MTRNSILSRRQLLAGAGALAGATLLPAWRQDAVAQSAASKDASDSKWVLGLQLYTLGEAPLKDFKGTLSEVAAIGYRTVELPSSYGQTAAQLRSALDETGLTCPGIHVVPRATPGSWDVQGDLGRLAADMHTLGATYATVSIVLLPDSIFNALQNPPSSGFTAASLSKLVESLTADDWKRTADLMNEKATALRSSGIRVAYHNHGFDFAPLPGGKSGFDILLERTDRNLVDLELDVGWAVSAKQNIEALFKRARGRIRLLHLKDTKSFAKNSVELASTDIGTGIVDWQQLFTLIREEKSEHLFVEQEAPFVTPPMQAVRAGYAYLTRNFAPRAR